MYGPFHKQLELRDIAAGPKTETASETGIGFDARMAGDFKAIVYVAARSATGACTISVQTDADAAFNGTPVTVGSVTVAANAKGVFEILLPAMQIAKLDPDAGAIRVTATLSGSTPSVTYGAYLAPMM